MDPYEPSNWWFPLRGPIPGFLPSFPSEHQQVEGQQQGPSFCPLRTDAFSSLHDFLLNHQDVSAEFLQALSSMDILQIHRFL